MGASPLLGRTSSRSGSECDVKNPVHINRAGFQELQRLLSNVRASKLHEEILERDDTHKLETGGEDLLTCRNLLIQYGSISYLPDLFIPPYVAATAVLFLFLGTSFVNCFQQKTTIKNQTICCE